ncbi:hypothetical protein NDU88_006398 [Pleurodeles waltl]|uniref:Uncharacterized protein n=1 Tax=Pleurodeles waltl TaxID=8319 RepID=A0AAV7X162_PLEWA|nr:hypothetical protein NDU88_006398 [Pleurodeles waltl]
MLLKDGVVPCAQPLRNDAGISTSLQREKKASCIAPLQGVLQRSSSGRPALLLFRVSCIAPLQGVLHCSSSGRPAALLFRVSCIAPLQGVLQRSSSGRPAALLFRASCSAPLQGVLQRSSSGRPAALLFRASCSAPLQGVLQRSSSGRPAALLFRVSCIAPLQGVLHCSSSGRPAALLFRASCIAPLQGVLQRSSSGRPAALLFRASCSAPLQGVLHCSSSGRPALLLFRASCSAPLQGVLQRSSSGRPAALLFRASCSAPLQAAAPQYSWESSNDNDNSLYLLETSYSRAKIIGLVTQAPPHSTRNTLSPSLLLLAPLAQLQGLPSRNAETGDPKLTLPGSQSVARRREERILTLASLSFKPSPGWGPGAQTHADPAVKATAAFPSLTRPDSQTGARRRDEETPHPRPFILQAVARGGGGPGRTIKRGSDGKKPLLLSRAETEGRSAHNARRAVSVRREFTAAR